MSTGDIVFLVLLAMFVLAMLWSVHRQRADDRMRTELDAQQQPEPAPAPTTPAGPPSPWVALPGGHLELGSTGFQIRQMHDHKQVDFVLFSPEGQWMVGTPHGHLEGLMKAAEKFAAERAMFEPCKSLPAIPPASNHDR